MNIPFDNSYARLPEHFYARLNPTPVARPSLIRLNTSLAEQLGLDADALASTDGISMLAGNQVPQGAQPLAMAYAGHQFGNWVPQLGDGRAILLGEIIDRDGQRQDIQLKGAGRTPFSRGGDGRAWVGPVLREYVVSETMAALGVPTTRALAAVCTGDTVSRERPMPGAVLTRVARSHIRVGTFQYFASRGDTDALRALTYYVIARHYPEVTDEADPVHALLTAVTIRQAELIAHWQALGFIHGVMNTDNASIAGDTIDYGPCAFMDNYHPETVFSSIDRMKRYAYHNQPAMAQWNCANFAQCLLPLMDGTEEAVVTAAQSAIDAFPQHYAAAYRVHMQRKLGLTEIYGSHDVADDLDGADDHSTTDSHAADDGLISSLFDCMAANTADFTLTFRALCAIPKEYNSVEHDSAARSLFDDPQVFDAWAKQWRQRLAVEKQTDAQRQLSMQRVNPAFIPRNHRIEEVIQAAVQDEDHGPFNELVTVLSRPCDDQPEYDKYRDPPHSDQIVRQTFCGT